MRERRNKKSPKRPWVNHNVLWKARDPMMMMAKDEI
jgi:hypothetical protein